MADGRIDTLDVGALERSVNDSAGRVSAIWLSFVAFSAYAAATASTISHRQLLLEDPIKLPTIGIDVPLVIAAILLPSLFVIYHVYVLLQVVLLARTADAYNDAVQHSITEEADRARVRQRLANTLFAQLFAGSSREREGLLGWLLRTMAWVTLALAPPLVLLVFELQFLPYHSAAVTWIHRFLIAFDLLAVLLLWAGAVDPRNDVTWRRILRAPISSSLATIVILFSSVALTFPGEPHAGWTRYRVIYDPDFLYGGDAGCHAKSYLIGVLSGHFDRISVVGEIMVDNDKLRKIEEIGKARGQRPYQGERTRNLRGRDLRCGNLGGVDLRRADFTGANLAGANLASADLQGAVFRSSDTRLRRAALDGVLLQGASLEEADLEGASMAAAQLQNAVLDKAAMKDVKLDGAKLTDAELRGTALQGASLGSAQMQRAALKGARLEGANLREADLSGADLEEAHLERATVSMATLTGANLKLAKLMGADIVNATLRGADLSMADLTAADLQSSRLEGARMNAAQLPGAVLDDAQLDGVSLYRATLVGASARHTKFYGTVLVQVQLQGSDLEDAEFDHALIENAFLWRSRRAGCKAAQVIKPRFEDAINVNFTAHTATREMLFGATPEAITEWIARTVEPLGADERAKRRAALQDRFNPDTHPEATAIQNEWLECARSSATRKDIHQARAEFFLKAFCEVEAKDLPAVEGFYHNWLFRIQGFKQDDGFNESMARGMLNQPCAGAAGLDKESKDELRTNLPK